MPSKYSIKELERLSGIKAHTLRIWEQRYHILQPSRTDSNIRCYSAADLKRILNISLLNHNGYKISKIAKLSDDAIAKEVEKILNTYETEDHQVESLILCMMDLNEARFEKVISSSIVHFGFENTVEKIIFPFMRQIGSMWQLGLVNPAHEHFISHLIRQKLMVGIDGLPATENPGAKSFLFFLPNEELHELGLLYSYFLVKARGHRCFYLGQSVPFEDLVNVGQLTEPDFLVTVFTTPFRNMEMQDYLDLLAPEFADSEIMVSGRLFFDGSSDYKLPGNVRLYEDPTDFKNKIQSLIFESKSEMAS